MTILSVCFPLILLCTVTCYGNFNFHKEFSFEEPIKSNVSKPLYLTPLLREGKIREAQTKSKVNLKGLPTLRSHSGFFTVRETFDSNLFFWFFKSENDWRSDPVILWLQGGPGASSLFALFAENGPIQLTHTNQLRRRRKYTWTRNHSMLYIDNPVGTGFSFTKPDVYAQNETVVAQDLYEALLQFFTLFPNLRRNDFFVFGESYAGKFVPAISHTILKKDPNGELMNWQGSAIGNGLTDPIHQLEYGEYLYQHGLIDWNALERLNTLKNITINYIEEGRWLEANTMFFNMTLFYMNETGLGDVYNYYQRTAMVNELLRITKYVTSVDVRANIHVGSMPFNGSNNKVGDQLSYDFMQSMAPWVSEILEHRRLLVYNGQLDIVCAYPMTVNYLRHLNFTSAKEYKTARRYEWMVDGSVAGYVKTAGNLTEVLVRDAGHIVPHDQPRSALDLVTRFTRNKPFH